MKLRGIAFTSNAGLPEADAMQVFVHMYIYTHSFKCAHTWTHTCK